MTQSYLIVGGSSDIALKLGEDLLAQGYALTLLARDVSRTNELASKGAIVVEGDALDKEAVQKAVDTAKEAGDGTLSGVAHLVGSLVLRPPHALALDAFNEVLHTNLSSAFLTLSIASKTMLRSGGGRLVFTSSVAASQGLLNHEAMAAAKGGIEAMARAAAATYGQRNIRVNVVAPGLTETRMAAPILRSEASREASIAMIPRKQLNQPEEIASSMRWLLCDAPDNMTGQVLHLDGGMANARG